MRVFGAIVIRLGRGMSWMRQPVKFVGPLMLDSDTQLGCCVTTNHIGRNGRISVVAG
jgi:hypothetical protein